MFEAFLSPDMTYSCAIFPNLDADTLPEHHKGRLEDDIKIPGFANEDVPTVRVEHKSSSPFPSADGQDELYEAQMRKLHHLIKKLRIPEHSDNVIRVLEIGSGWGALAILLTQTYPFVEVDSLTLSSEQKALAEERIRAAGVEGRVRIWLMDYRSIPESWNATFDRFVSVEMIEHVGLEFLPTYWGVVERCLKPKNAVGVVQASTMPEPRYEQDIRGTDFIRKWSKYYAMFEFLNAKLPFLYKFSQAFTSQPIANIGPHYARTLREWGRRFSAKFESDIAPALQRAYPDVNDRTDRGRREIEVFKRKWMYYYCYCEVAFSTRTFGGKPTPYQLATNIDDSFAVHVMTFVREGYQGYGCDVYA
ncbi:cyclopropane-fatty-acyl-phospholipid synthase [Ceratobasidium sp. AG-Ba]|nr:cyclopropane-fatty-acyl-phospholipid synthase [Ceratobasidium sp. AG-Ba]QRV99378.1 cyclopropane-fatty-acyl-phospholipid synthase [Ceratobasidium sp. AG-Ba]QRW13883.1 cyclopropane-fatty-acyl-phospholipid synthase [Ceratobasidium sp. AG-Ba]